MPPIDDSGRVNDCIKSKGSLVGLIGKTGASGSEWIGDQRYGTEFI